MSLPRRLLFAWFAASLLGPAATADPSQDAPAQGAEEARAAREAEYRLGIALGAGRISTPDEVVSTGFPNAGSFYLDIRERSSRFEGTLEMLGASHEDDLTDLFFMVAAKYEVLPHLHVGVGIGKSVSLGSRDRGSALGPAIVADLRLLRRGRFGLDLRGCYARYSPGSETTQLMIGALGFSWDASAGKSSEGGTR